jgi:hypothetical protein
VVTRMLDAAVRVATLSVLVAVVIVSVRLLPA